MDEIDKLLKITGIENVDLNGMDWYHVELEVKHRIKKDLKLLATIRALRKMKTDLTNTVEMIDIDRIATDHPKTTRDRIRMVERIIITISTNNQDNAAGIEEIVTAANENKLERSEVEQIVAMLKSKGVISEPTPGRYKLEEF